jgi:hypothetical protein
MEHDGKKAKLSMILDVGTSDRVEGGETDSDNFTTTEEENYFEEE